ncbi:MAG: hypothetical protein H6658_09675 [Ardenticatenaceae bacterium]|nr:hypothetical protein [Ardenticatenaceae bacterium]
MTRLFLKRLLVTVALVWMACTAVSCTNFTSADSVDESEVYAAVIRQIYTVDDTFSGTFKPAVVYLINSTDDSVGDPEIEQLVSHPLDAEMQKKITAALSDLPAQWIWVDSRDDVPINPDTGGVEGEGAIITLGNIHPQEDDSIQVSGSIYVGNLAAGGQTYVLEQVDGNWTVTGNTGMGWVS